MKLGQHRRVVQLTECTIPAAFLVTKTAVRIGPGDVKQFGYRAIHIFFSHHQPTVIVFQFCIFFW